MALLALDVLDDAVPHVLASERAHLETLEGDAASAYRPTRVWLRPPTTAQVALFFDRRHAGLVGQGSVEIAGQCVTKIEALRPKPGAPPEDFEGPGLSLLRKLRFSDIVDIGLRLAELGDPDDEDFG